MKIVRRLAGGPCGAADDCAEVSELEDGSGLARGYKLDVAARATLAMPDNEDAIVLPPAVMEELRRALKG